MLFEVSHNVHSFRQFNSRLIEREHNRNYSALRAPAAYERFQQTMFALSLPQVIVLLKKIHNVLRHFGGISGCDCTSGEHDITPLL